MRFLWPTRFIIFGFCIGIISIHCDEIPHFSLLLFSVFASANIIVSSGAMFFLILFFRILIRQWPKWFRARNFCCWLVFSCSHNLLPYAIVLQLSLAPKWHFLHSQTTTISSKSEWSKSEIKSTAAPSLSTLCSKQVEVKLNRQWIYGGPNVYVKFTWKSCMRQYLEKTLLTSTLNGNGDEIKARTRIKSDLDKSVRFALLLFKWPRKTNTFGCWTSMLQCDFNTRLRQRRREKSNPTHTHLHTPNSN